MRTLDQVVLVLILSAAATLSQAGCFRCEPILNVAEAAVASPSGKSLSADQVKTSIVRAGTGLGWQIREERAGLLIGTLVLRSHTAVVEIPYSTTSYSIRYKSSIHLDEGEGQIHKNYNGWIKNLTRGINTQLSL